MDYLGINIGCVIGSLQDGKFPEKDCLLPVLSKVLGYLIVALSTTVKLPQVTVPPSLFSLILHMKLINGWDSLCYSNPIIIFIIIIFVHCCTIVDIENLEA